MWFPTKNGKVIKEADEASAQAYRIAFRADPVAHCRKMTAALSRRLGETVRRLGKMAVLIQEPNARFQAPGLDFVVAEYFLANGTSDYAVFGHVATSDTYNVEIAQFDPATPRHEFLLKSYGCTSIFNLMKDSSFPERMG